MPNKAKNEVVDSLVQAGVIQSIEAPKAEYVVSIPEAQQIDTIVEKFIEADELLFEGDSLMQTTAKALGKLFGVAPTYAQYMTIRQMWIRKYMAQMPSSSEEATQKHWERLFKRVNKETGLDKPKAPSKAAVAMSAKRAEAQAKLQSMADVELVDFFHAGLCHTSTQGFGLDFVIQHGATFGAELFGISQPLDGVKIIEDDGCGKNRAGQWPATGLVHARHQAGRVPVEGALFSAQELFGSHLRCSRRCHVANRGAWLRTVVAVVGPARVG